MVKLLVILFIKFVYDLIGKIFDRVEDINS